MEIQFTDLSVPDPKDSYNCSGYYQSTGFTYLMKLVLMVNNNPEVVPIIEELIKDPVILNAQNDKGWTALMLACVYSNTFSNNSIVQMLINAGANINLVADNIGSCLMLAILCNNEGNAETVKILINSGADVNIKYKRKYTPLMLACSPFVINQYGAVATFPSNIEIIAMLIDAGANVNDVLDDGHDALMLVVESSVKKNKIEIVKMLIDAGANVNNKTDYATSTLIEALRFIMSEDVIEIVRMLIDAGAEVNYADASGNTALMWAHKIESIKMLIDAGADIDHKNTNNMTFLMLFFKRFKIDKSHEDLIIHLLHISKKTLPDKDSHGKSAYDYYLENDHNILDEYHLKLLKCEITQNNTKSARVN